MENSILLTPKGKINEILRSIRSDGGVSSGLDWAISQVKRKRKLGPGRSQRQNNYGLCRTHCQCSTFNVQTSPASPLDEQLYMLSLSFITLSHPQDTPLNIHNSPCNARLRRKTGARIINSQGLDDKQVTSKGASKCAPPQGLTGLTPRQHHNIQLPHFAPLTVSWRGSCIPTLETALFSHITMMAQAMGAVLRLVNHSEIALDVLYS
jgi:hypothetical protein